jgi:hypothetical protein
MVLLFESVRDAHYYLYTYPKSHKYLVEMTCRLRPMHVIPCTWYYDVFKTCIFESLHYRYIILRQAKFNERMGRL